MGGDSSSSATAIVGIKIFEFDGLELAARQHDIFKRHPPVPF